MTAVIYISFFGFSFIFVRKNFLNFSINTFFLMNFPSLPFIHDKVTFLFLNIGSFFIYHYKKIVKTFEYKRLYILLSLYIITGSVSALVTLSKFKESINPNIFFQHFSIEILIFLLIIIFLFLKKENKYTDKLVLLKGFEGFFYLSVFLGIYDFIAIYHIDFLPPISTINRFKSFTAGPNVAGFMLALTSHILNEKFIQKNKLSWILFKLSSYSLVLFTGSRSGLIVLILSEIYFLLNFKKQANKKIITLSSLVVISIILNFKVFNQYGFAKRISELAKPTKSLQNDPRLAFWKKSSELFSESPLIGVGTGLTNGIIKTINDPKEGDDPHNIVICLLTEKGIIGFILFILICLELRKISGFRYKNNPHLSFTLLLTLLFGVWHSMIYNLTYVFIVLLIIFNKETKSA